MAKKLVCGNNSWENSVHEQADFQEGDPNYATKIAVASAQALNRAEAAALAALADSSCPAGCGFPVGTYTTEFQQIVWTRHKNPINKPGNPPLPDSFTVTVYYRWTANVYCFDAVAWMQGKSKKFVLKSAAKKP